VPKLAYKRFNQKTAAVAQRSSADSDVNANNLAKCSGVKPSMTHATNTMQRPSGKSSIDRSRMSQITPSAI
jgi:hypothetical protein